MERVRLGERFERGMLLRQMSEMEVLSSRGVLSRAEEAFAFGERFWGVFRGDEEPPSAHGSDGEGYPTDPDEFREHFADWHLHRFIRTVRKELGVTTEFKPWVICHKGEPLGIPEDVQEIKEREASEARPWWSRMFGG